MSRLLLLASLLVSGALAANYCPDGALNGNVGYSATAAGTSDSATGCRLGSTGESVLTLGLASAAAAPGAQITVTFTDGSIENRSLIRVNLPSADAAAGAVPIRVEITGNTFQTGSGLQVFGSLSPGSVVLIRGNSFSVAAASPAPSWFVDVFAGVALYVERLHANTILSVFENTIEGIGALTTGSSTVGISWRGGASYGDGASALISRNSITLACSSPLNPTFDMQACVLGMHLAANQFFEGNAASAQITDNTFAVTGGLIAALPAVSSGAGVIGNTFSFSGNSGSANTTGAMGSDAISLGAVTAGSDTVVAFEENTFTIVGTTACSIGLALAIPVEAVFGGGGLDNPTAMSGNAALVLSRNAITTTGCDCQLLLRRDHTMADSARVQIDENTVLRTDQGSGGAAVEIRNGLTLQGSGALSLAGNTFDSTPRPADAAQLIGFGLSLTSSVSGAVGSIRACGNGLYGAQLASDEQVRARCVEAVADIVVSGGCFGALPTETVQNTITLPTPPPTTPAPTTTPTTTTPAPTTPAPTTPAPTTPAPTTPAPTTPAPTTPAPTTPAPTTPAPTTPAPTTPAPTTPTTTTPAPTTPAPTTPAPTTPAPTTPAPTSPPTSDPTAIPTTAVSTETTIAPTTEETTNAVITTVEPSTVTGDPTFASVTTTSTIAPTNEETTTFETVASTRPTIKPTQSSASSRQSVLLGFALCLLVAFVGQ